VTAVEDDASAAQGPCRTVGGISGSVDVGAWVAVLVRWLDEGVAAPCRCIQAEMCSCAAGECEDDRGEHLDGGG
jgi:hypothetical protein